MPETPPGCRIRWQAPLLLSLAVLAASQTGCVRRRMTIRSDPPGALVYVDDQQIGATPISTDLARAPSIMILASSMESRGMESMGSRFKF